MNLAAVDKVEDLKHDEGVENKGKVSGIDFGLIVDRAIVGVSVDVNHSTATNCPSNYAIVPFPRGVSSESSTH